MKIVVIGGSGLIGSKTVKKLIQQGHEVIAASPSTGVNAVTGEGLAEALKGAQVVVDVANSPSFEEKPVMDFFESSGRNLMAAAKAAGVKHHVALSVVGTERLLDSGYFRAKMVQENLIKASGIPYTIVRATQFFEFIGAITESGADGNTVRLSSSDMQPISADDVADAMAHVANAAPISGMIEIAGPECAGIAKLAQRYLTAIGDKRTVVGDPSTPYFGVVLNDRSLTPNADALIGKTSFEDWLKKSLAEK